MGIIELKEKFEKEKKIYDSALLKFSGVDGWDVYNCSVPFKIDGKTYLYGRVERNNEWANSHVCLFKNDGPDSFVLVPEFVSIPLEDPFVQKINNELVLGGTHVQKSAGSVSNYFGYFYRGTPYNVKYYTTGPSNMKDIRLVPLKDGKIGVFSRHRKNENAVIGFAVIDDLSKLTADTISSAPGISGILEGGQWGGINQAYLLESGKIGCIGHFSYGKQVDEKLRLSVYTNGSFVFDPEEHSISDLKIIGTKSCYPESAPKVPKLEDCVFTSGMVVRDDGLVDLYSGVGDTAEGRITIDYPFGNEGKPVSDLNF